MDLATRMAALATAVRWLGPWADPHARPDRIERTTWCAPAGAKAWVYRGVRPQRRVLVVPGVHFDGPTDPRLDRLCRIFAATGAVVAVPFVPSYMRLEVSPAAIETVRAVWAGLRGAGCLDVAGPTMLFSISFGCLPALRLATDPAFAGDFDDVVTFGGYSDFATAFRFALTGQTGESAEDRPYDPLNRPVAFCSLLDQMAVRVADPVALRAAWVRYARRTWGRPEMKLGRRYAEEAAGVAHGVRTDDRALFLLGCGVSDGGVELCLDALSRTEASFTDPLAHVERLRARVLAVHGRGDDVVPAGESVRLAERAARYTRAGCVLTGAYGHTGSAGASVGAVVRETSGLAQVLTRLAGADSVRARR